jgi:hypothetical protein
MLDLTRRSACGGEALAGGRSRLVHAASTCGRQKGMLRLRCVRLNRASSAQGSPATRTHGGAAARAPRQVTSGEMSPRSAILPALPARICVAVPPICQNCSDSCTVGWSPGAHPGAHPAANTLFRSAASPLFSTHTRLTLAGFLSNTVSVHALHPVGIFHRRFHRPIPSTSGAPRVRGHRRFDSDQT